jgi:hypothetical protein
MKAAGRVNNEKFPFKTMRRKTCSRVNITNRADFSKRCGRKTGNRVKNITTRIGFQNNEKKTMQQS